MIHLENLMEDSNVDAEYQRAVSAVGVMATVESNYLNVALNATALDVNPTMG